MTRESFETAVILLLGARPSKPNEYTYIEAGGMPHTFKIRPRQNTITFYHKNGSALTHIKEFYKYALAFKYLERKLNGYRSKIKT